MLGGAEVGGPWRQWTLALRTPALRFLAAGFAPYLTREGLAFLGAAWAGLGSVRPCLGVGWGFWAGEQEAGCPLEA